MMPQSLSLFVFSKPQKKSFSFHESANSFLNDLPYRQLPYSKRNWGHPWHSLCSYHGKLKPAIAHFLISNFTRQNDRILDPLCGVGTIPFEACLLGRAGFGNDLSEMAYVVSKAKIEPPTYEDAVREVANLKKHIEGMIGNPEISRECKIQGTFGFNKCLSEYFHPDTFREIICARDYFLKLGKKLSSAQVMAFASLLHILHGNRPYALSRTSHPLTPYAPTGDFTYKNLIVHLQAKIDLSFINYGKPKTGGKVFHGDFAKLANDKLKGFFDAVVTSPPFAKSIRFYMFNWMRLWLCGWNHEDFRKADDIFLDRKQAKDFSVYRGFFSMCAHVLKPKGRVILHLGKTANIDMALELAKCASPLFSEICHGSESVSQIEKHGIVDKGGTMEHQYLFLEKKLSN